MVSRSGVRSRLVGNRDSATSGKGGVVSQVSGPVPGVLSRPGVEAMTPLVAYLLGAASAVAVMLAGVVLDAIIAPYVNDRRLKGFV